MLSVSCMGLLLRPPSPGSVKSFLFLVSSDLRGNFSHCDSILPPRFILSMGSRFGISGKIGLLVLGSTDLICNPSSFPSHFFSLYLSCQYEANTGEYLMSLLAVIVAHVDKLLLSCHFSLLRSSACNKKHDSDGSMSLSGAVRFSSLGCSTFRRHPSSAANTNVRDKANVPTVHRSRQS